MNQAVITFTNSTARASAITSPVEGMVTYLADTDTYQFWNGSAWTNLVSSSGTGNAIINGAFDIWQRGSTFTNQTNGAFSADRWRANTTNNTLDVSRSTFTLGSAPLAGLDGKFFATIAAEASDSDARLIQPIEGVQNFSGQTITVSFYAKSTVTTDAIRYIRIRQNFGTGGSPSTLVDTDSSAITLTGSWARYTATISLPSISGKTLGTDGNDRLEVHIGLKASTAQTLDLWGVQVEAGSTATAFRRNGANIADELASCQRYCQVLRNSTAGPVNYAAGSAYNSAQSFHVYGFPVQMRATPTATFLTASNYAVTNSAGNSVNCTSLSAGGNRESFTFNGNTAGGLTTGHASLFQLNAGASLILDGEL
jgi:hypothetical protein